MTDDPATVAAHYAHGTLIDAIRAGLAALGKTPETVTVDDLAPIDEFHIGGRRASADFLGQLGLGPASHVLDVGCGLGGGGRFTASRFGARVTGIDLTPDYVATGQALSRWVGLAERITLRTGSALDMPFDDGGFDAAYLMHVGMNIADKRGLCAEVARVLKPGGRFGIYDVMRIGPGDLAFPVPWAATPATSAVAPPEAYRDALEAAGFTLIASRDRRDFALDFFAELRARAADGPPPLGLHILMGPTAPEKVKNMIANITAGRLAPVELIVRK